MSLLYHHYFEPCCLTRSFFQAAILSRPKRLFVVYWSTVWTLASRSSDFHFCLIILGCRLLWLNCLLSFTGRSWFLSPDYLVQQSLLPQSVLCLSFYYHHDTLTQADKIKYLILILCQIPSSGILFISDTFQIFTVRGRCLRSSLRTLWHGLDAEESHFRFFVDFSKPGIQ